MVLVGGRLYSLAHGAQKIKVTHLSVAAGLAVWGVDAKDSTLLDVGRQWCGKAYDC